MMEVYGFTLGEDMRRITLEFECVVRIKAHSLPTILVDVGAYKFRTGQPPKLSSRHFLVEAVHPRPQCMHADGLHGYLPRP